MATEVDRAYYGWSQGEMSDGDDSQGVAASKMVDHGSVSFGRFAAESLSWERRSVFTHNRHQEELEKFNGFVAKKKAYFEERYKRIRALKASKNNQQTELTLDYGADDSISSQTGEEDGAASPRESPRKRDGVNPAAPLPADVEIGYEVLEQVSGVVEPNSTIASPEISLSEENIGRIEHCEKSKGEVDVGPIEMEALPSLAQQFEVIAPESVDNEEGKIENVEKNVEIREAPAKAPFRGTKDSGHNKMRPAKKPLYSKLATNAKGTAAEVRNGRILDRRSTAQNPSQASKGINQPSQKIVGKAVNNQISSRGRDVQKVSNNHRSALVPSNRAVAESHSKISASGLFTLVMERRVSNRTSASKVDTSSTNKLPPPPRLANSGSNMQDTKKLRSASLRSTKGGLESKREINYAIKKPLAADSRQIATRRNETKMFGSAKPRMSSSLNLPARNTIIGNESQISASRVMKIKEEKKTVELRQSQGVTAKSFRSSLNGDIKIATKKPTQARNKDQFLSASKQLDNLSLDGRKTRRETHQWR